MGKTAKYVILFLIFDAVVIGGYFGLRALRGGGGSVLDAYDWVTIDESYVPKNDVETYIKGDAESRGALPVFIKNYGSNEKVLRRFKGKQYAKPTVSLLNMLNQGLDDWMLVAIRYTNENEREVNRTVLYLFVRKQWKVGDSGTLIR